MKLKCIKLCYKKAGAFGSYGWSGEAAGLIKKELEESKLEYFLEPLKLLYVPDSEKLKVCMEYGINFAKLLKEEK
jgi:flavorubredoxin